MSSPASSRPQALSAFSVLAYSFVIAYVIGFAIDKTIGFRIDEEDEVSGIDLREHAETAYDLSTASGGAFTSRPVGTKTDVGANA